MTSLPPVARLGNFAATIRARANGQNVLILLGLLFAPAICLILIPHRMNQAGFIDDYFYTSYMVNMRRMVERYDLTYYLLRMAAIMPGRAIYHLFGPLDGFIVLRYLQILVGCSSLFLIARRFYGLSIACLAALFLCCSPWYLRAVTWDYVDGFSINYMLAGLAFVLVPQRHRNVAFVGAGACFAFATNCILFTIAIWLPFLPSWLVIEGRKKWTELASFTASFVLGFVAAYAVLALLLHTVRPGRGLFFESYALKYAKGLLQSGGAVWHQTFFPYLSLNYYVLTPVAVLVAALFFLLLTPWRRLLVGRTRLTVAFTLYLAVVMAVYVLDQSLPTAAGAIHTRGSRFYWS